MSDEIQKIETPTIKVESPKFLTNNGSQLMQESVITDMQVFPDI